MTSRGLQQSIHSAELIQPSSSRRNKRTIQGQGKAQRRVSTKRIRQQILPTLTRQVIKNPTRIQQNQITLIPTGQVITNTRIHRQNRSSLITHQTSFTEIP